MPTHAEDSIVHKIHPAVAVAAGVALLLATSFFFAATASRLLSARASRSWPETEGFIIESRLSSNSTYCRPVINYRYMVNGQSFVGDDLVAGPQDHYGSHEAQAEIDRYPVGRKVAVFYDPANPSTCCIEPGVFRWEVYLFSLITISCLSSSLLIFWRVFRGRRQ